MCFLCVCFVCFSRLSRSFPLSSLCTNKQTNKKDSCFLCKTTTQPRVSSKSVKSLIIRTKSGRRGVLEGKNRTFCGTLILALISSSSSSFFLSFRAFPFREREGEREREREDTSSFPRARERKRSEERDLFLLRKCPPLRNRNGNKMKRLF